MIHYLYRFHSSSELLYVGVTTNIDQRLHAHRAQKTWWPEVQRIELQTYASREDVLKAEATVIASEHPKYNEQLSITRDAVVALDLSRPKTYAKLPQDEVDYLRTLNSEETFNRCALLQRAGWSVPAMLDGAKIAPTPTQLRTELKYIHAPFPMDRPVPAPPVSARQQAHEAEIARNNQLTDSEKTALKTLHTVAKLRKAYHTAGTTEYAASEAFANLIKRLYDRGVLLSEIARTVGVDTSNIRRRLP